MQEEAASILPDLTQSAIGVVLDPKTALSVGGATAAGGLSEILLHIPWPAIATAAGSILSIILGIIQIWKFAIHRRGRLDDHRIRLLEEQILEQKINDHV